MTKPPIELLKGTLDLLILRTLNLHPMHGSAIADRISQVTQGAFQVKAGVLFPPFTASNKTAPSPASGWNPPKAAVSVPTPSPVTAAANSPPRKRPGPASSKQ